MSTEEIPKTMKRLVVKAPGKDVASCQIEIQEVPVPPVPSGFVLIKVVAAAVNPSDYGSWIRCRQEQCPFAMGNEGCGIVVKSGGGYSNEWWCPVGTPVGFVGLKDKQGAYSEYVVVQGFGGGVFPLPKDLPVEDAASFFVNPFTTLAILDTVRSHGSKAFVHTAAASQLGQMLVKIAPEEGIEVINVVRRQEQAETLRNIGAKHVVVTGSDENEESWKEELKAMVKELDASVAFDAVAGRMTGDIMDVMPKASVTFLYGGLAGKVTNINPMGMIYHKKKFQGFLLNSWLMDSGFIQMFRRMTSASRRVNSGLAAGGWSSSQFKDTTKENVQADLVKLLGGSATGQKLRVRFDK